MLPESVDVIVDVDVVVDGDGDGDEAVNGTSWSTWRPPVRGVPSPGDVDHRARRPGRE